MYTRSNKNLSSSCTVIKQNERTRIDKVRRLLEDLPRRGSNAYHDFLKVLRETGYKYLANEIVENEEIIRRENARKESSNDQPHPDGLVVHGKGKIYML